MSCLVISCRFVAHSYQGIRLTDDRREVLDWPPAPGRLFQALLSVALSGRQIESPDVTSSLDALRWLERLRAPVIGASKLVDGHRTRPRVAIPQNNPKQSSLLEHSTLLAPTERPLGKVEEALCVEYRWNLLDEQTERQAETHLFALSDLVAQLRYLGRGEDWVESAASIEDEGLGESQDASRDTWNPTSDQGDIQLSVARASSVDRLIKRHETGAGLRERRESAQRHLDTQHYGVDCAQGLQPVAVAVFQLLPANDDPDVRPLSCDPENAGIWRSRLRDKVIEIANDESYWDNPSLALELISGHPPGSAERTEQPHLAIVPIPSINTAGTADGRVRRIALVGYSRPPIRGEAEEIYHTLASSLDNQVLVFPHTDAQLRLISTSGRDEIIWRQLSRPSRHWSSLTPVALARGFNVPTYSSDGVRRLSGNERHRYKLAEWSKLVRESLRHIGLPESTVTSCNVILTQTPLYPGTQRAERYRPPGESAAFTHVQLEFSELVRGPLLVGDRRYRGFGLFAPLA